MQSLIWTETTPSHPTNISPLPDERSSLGRHEKTARTAREAGATEVSTLDDTSIYSFFLLFKHIMTNFENLFATERF